MIKREIDLFNRCFNTQPPEGGWFCFKLVAKFISGFNTQPPEGGWQKIQEIKKLVWEFQHTAARRRLVQLLQFRQKIEPVSTHSRPKAAGFWLEKGCLL